MKKIVLISCAVLAATVSTAVAREISTTMTKEDFRLACRNGTNRTYVNHTADTASCVLADGTIIYCNFATGTCTVPRGLPPKGVKQLLGDRFLGTVK
ncbi:MAG: hypothetical protein Q8L53_00560 [Aestuariivirga sp.]|nr:hypothetical protein [Aestuariivirga sp.]